MRFLSKFGRFETQVEWQVTEAFASGGSKIVRPQLTCKFHEGGMTPEERELALKSWVFEGSYQDVGESMTIPPDYRIGVFDTEQAQLENGWSDEAREKVEQHLINHARRFEDVLVVPRVHIPPPWPRYDEYTGTPAALVRKLVDEGHSLDAVLTYERAMQKREEIIVALEEAISDPDTAYEPEEEIVG